MWEIYDELIAGIPADWTADEIVRGSDYAYVKSRGGIGLGGLLEYDHRAPLFSKNLEGMPLREVAACIKSWNFGEATIGLAAINAYYNHPETARAAGVPIAEKKHFEDRLNDPFIMSQNEIRGKKVTVLGHFPHLETLFEPICDMRIISGEVPEDGDYPLPAVEFLLPESDFVFISCSCLVSKTMPRILELSGKARKVTIVGPATPLAPALFGHGVHDLSGFVVTDQARAMRMVKGAEHGKFFAAGQKVALKR